MGQRVFAVMNDGEQWTELVAGETVHIVATT